MSYTRLDGTPFPNVAPDGTILSDGPTCSLTEIREWLPPRGSRCLEVGPKWGHHTLDLARLYEDLWLLEHPKAERLVVGWLPDTLRSRLVWGVLPEIPAAISTIAPFDAIFFLGVLYHLDEQLRTLRGLAACLKPGGRLLVETVIDPAEGQTLRLFWPDAFRGVGTIRFLPTREALRALVSLSGFEVIESKPNPIGPSQRDLLLAVRNEHGADDTQIARAKVHERVGSYAAGLMVRAHEAEARGDLDEAGTLYERAYEAHPGWMLAAYNWASICRRQGHQERSRELFERVATGAGDAGLRAKARFHLGALAVDAGDWEAAGSQLDACVAEEPDHQRAKELRTFVRSRIHDPLVE